MNEINNPTYPQNSKAFGGLEITRIAPGDQKILIEFTYTGVYDRQALFFEVSIKKLRDGTEVGYWYLSGTDTSFIFEDLRNGIDYMVEILAREKNTENIVARSPVRLFRTGFVPGIVINYIHPDDYTYNSSGRSTASPSLVRLPDGRLLVSHDIYWGGGGQNLTKIFESNDNGKTWKYLSDVYPCFWGSLFVHANALYMLGMSTEYGALQIFRSDDWGKTWSQPAVILEGGSREKGGPHRGPMPIVNYNGRLWTAIDYGSWQIGGHASGVASVPVDADLMNPDNWTVTPFLPYDPTWPGTIKGGKPSLLEGNIVITPEGELVNFLRYHTAGGQPEYGRAVMLNVDKDHPDAPLTFGRVVDFLGNMSKFTIRLDEKSGKYYSLINRVTIDWVFQRNILTLISSPDLIHWKIERDILNYQDNNWPEDHTKVGFQYVDWIFDEDDILAVSRTAINGAYNYHNANYITFHRIINFRR